MNDIEDVLEQLKIDVANVGEREISAHCPFHKDSHPSFSMNAESGLWICYQCGESGTLDMLVEKVGGTVDVKAFLREAKVKNLTKKEEPKEEPVKEQTFDAALMYARYRSYRNPPIWALEERQLSRYAVDLYGIKWDMGWIIPIWAPEDAELWGWQYKRADVVSNYPPAVKKSRTLFGLPEVAAATVALVESPLDVVRLASVGITAVSSFGAMVSKAQVRLLIDVADKIILALDNDEEGMRQTDKLYRYLNKFVPTKRITYPASCLAKDPGEMSDREVETVFYDDLQRHASPVSGGRHRHDARSRLAPSRPRDGFGQDRHLHRSH